jgi:hypothetical protein
MLWLGEKSIPRAKAHLASCALRDPRRPKAKALGYQPRVPVPRSKGNSAFSFGRTARKAKGEKQIPPLRCGMTNKRAKLRNDKHKGKDDGECDGFDLRGGCNER